MTVPKTRLILVVVATLFVLARPALAIDRAIEDVRLSRTGESAEAMIDLACSMRYVDHTPTGSGMEVRIRLRVSPVCWRELGGIRSEVLRPEGRQMAQIEEVEFDASALSAVNVTIRFARPVAFTVSQSLSGLRLAVDMAAPADANKPVAKSEPVPSTRTPRRRVARSMPRLVPGARTRIESAPDIDRFAIQLAAYPENRDIPAPVLDAALAEKFYLRDLEINGQRFVSLRAGFFDTEEEAVAVARELGSRFPDLVILVANPAEQTAAENALVVPRSSVVAATESAIVEDADFADEALVQFMAEAKIALRDGELDRAVALYTKALGLPGTGHRKEAREYLGLARERKGQVAHAKAEYEAFLAEFPDGADADRVRQRLAGMLAVAQNVAINRPASQRTRVAAAPTVQRWDYHGGFSQYFRHDATEPSTDGVESFSQSAVMSFADFWTRRAGERFDLEARVAAGYQYELSGDRYSDGDQAHVSDAFLQVDDRKLGVGARIGRQTQYGKGILGRFDGANISYRWRPGVAVSVTGGMPADTPRHAPDGRRVFIGMSMDAENVADLFDVSLFTHIQRFDGIADREAVGGEARYRDDRWSVVASTDYDFSYGVLNWALLSGSFRASDRITITGRADIHAYPFLTTGNALIGQPVATIDDLKEVYSEGQIRTLARDRTAQARTAALGMSTILTDRLQLNADVSYSHIDATEASGGVEEIPDSGDQFYMDLSLIGSSFLKMGDTTILSLRRSDTSNAATNTLLLDMRYPFGQGFRVSPRVAVSHREYSSDGTTQWVVSPMLRLLYRWHRRYRLELDVGARWTDRDIEQTYFGESVFEGEEQWTEYYVNLGYQAEF